MAVEPDRPAFRAFLSHRYEAPEINLYFYRLFSEQARVQFEVDPREPPPPPGEKPVRKRTNVTRLERMVRNADAFIGIFPLQQPGARGDDFNAHLRRESQYFRLELDLAIRSGKPAIVFYDQAYGSVIAAPGSIDRFDFEAEEILQAGGSRNEDVHRDAIAAFCRRVAAFRSMRRGAAGRKIGILVPAGDGPGEYSQAALGVIDDVARKAKGAPKPEIIPETMPFGGPGAQSLTDFDWLVVDVGERGCRSGLVPFLHGRFVPMLRLLQLAPGSPKDAPSPLQATVFGAHEVGYPSDILRWQEPGALRDGLLARVQRIDEPTRLFASVEHAEEYFRGAAQRPEAVFVSYTRSDASAAEPIIRVLKMRFKAVFDYMDGSSITPGQVWRDEISRSVKRACLAVLLVSPSYAKSHYCMDEANQLLTHHHDGAPITIIPVMLDTALAKPPDALSTLQPILRWKYATEEAVVEALIAGLAVDLARRGEQPAQEAARK